MEDRILPTEKMWRTLVRVKNVFLEFVVLIVPGFSVREEVHCNVNGIPPAIYKNMKPGNRYHVGCNIGAQEKNSLCFDGWEED